MRDWTEHRRALLDALLDLLIPANPARGIPAAGAFGTGDFIARMTARDDALAVLVDDILDRAARVGGALTEDAVRRIEADAPDAFGALLRLTYMGYYSRPEIRPLVGVAPWPVHPEGYEVPSEPAALMGELTAPVRARGAVYRDV